MNDQERLEFIILALASGNARNFSRKTGIHPSSISKIKAGTFHLARFVDRILEAYPDVSGDWLRTGEGEPMKKKPKESEIMAKLDELECKMDRLLALLEKVS